MAVRCKYGEVAQLARACGSYPQCRGFKSLPRYALCLELFRFISNRTIKPRTEMSSAFLLFGVFAGAAEGMA